MSFTSVPPTAITATVSRSGIPRAGTIYNLTCTVTKQQEGLINSPNATWTIGGVAVMSGNGITTSVVSTNTATLSTLIFDPLRSSHNGRYGCCGTLVSPAQDTPLTSLIFETVFVQSMSILCIPPGSIAANFEIYKIASYIEEVSM